MSDLRTILLLIGIGVILAVYAWTRWQQQNRRSASKTPPAALRASSTDLDSADIEQELQRMERLVAGEEPEATEQPPPVAPVDEERLLVISVVAAEGDLFAGEALHRAFEQNKLRLGDKGIYQRVVYLAGKEQPVFGVANLVKPGTFPPGSMERFSTPGVTLFLQLPGPVSGLDAFDDFVKTAERLAVVFGAELRDEHHRVLTHQALMQIREDIAEARFRPRVAS
jgi:cell division protein ZipA